MRSACSIVCDGGSLVCAVGVAGFGAVEGAEATVRQEEGRGLGSYGVTRMSIRNFEARADYP